VYWLRLPTTSQDRGRAEVAVDARSYKPVLFRTYLNGRHFDQRVLVAKATTYRASEFERRGPSLVNGSGSSSSEGTSSSGPYNPSAPPTAVRAPWLTAGRAVAGLKLRSAQTLTTTSDSGGKRRSFKGLELTYGSLSHGAASPLSTTVDELSRPDTPQTWSHIPAGSIEIQKGEESGTGGTHTLWTGHLKKHGIYLTIETSRGERALLEIARVLQRGRG
ncbi:MAG: hypothetical protein ACRDL7_16310, partial [Gaiellaceae bacterium]